MEVISNNMKTATFGIVNDAPIKSMIANALINGHPLFWCNGIVFSNEPNLMSDWTSQELAAGNVYYFSLTKCEMKEYKKTLDDGNNSKIPVINMDHHKF